MPDISLFLINPLWSDDTMEGKTDSRQRASTLANILMSIIRGLLDGRRDN